MGPNPWMRQPPVGSIVQLSAAPRYFQMSPRVVGRTASLSSAYSAALHPKLTVIGVEALRESGGGSKEKLMLKALARSSSLLSQVCL